MSGFRTEVYFNATYGSHIDYSVFSSANPQPEPPKAWTCTISIV